MVIIWTITAVNNDMDTVNINYTCQEYSFFVIVPVNGIPIPTLAADNCPTAYFERAIAGDTHLNQYLDQTGTITV